MSIPEVYDPETTALEGIMLLEASAGTGKTYALERMVARLVSRPGDPMDIGSILVVTFTNRAAREMKERIRGILAERSADGGRSDYERSCYLRALSEFDRAPVYTIHGFCQMVLSTWPFESDAPFGQDLEPGGLVEAAETRSWLAELKADDIDDVLLRNAYDSAGSVEGLVAAIVAELSDDRVPPGSRILPDAGELKRFAAFRESSREPSSPLNRAAGALFARSWSNEGFNGLFKAQGMKRGKTARILDVIRAHLSACSDTRGLEDLSAALLGDPGRVGVNKHFTDLFRAAVDFRRGSSVNPEEVEPGSESEELAGVLYDLFTELEPYVGISDASSGSMESLVDRYMWRAFLGEAVEKLKPRVEQRKDLEGRWGYVDLIHRVAEAVGSGNSSLRTLLRSRFRAALIDEFQDTDPRQWQLFHGLFGEAPHILALIGDPKQSIYGFRGTGLQAYNGAKESVSRLYRLDTNYRSVPPLVNAVNRLFHPLFTSALPGNTPVGFEMVAAGKESGAVCPGVDDTSPVSLLTVPSLPADRGGTGRSAADAVSREIRRILEAGNAGSRPASVGEDNLSPVISASDIAVLVRSAKLENAVLESLRNEGIPAIIIRSRTVFSSPAAGPLVSLLKALERPADVPRWKALLLGDFFSLPASLLPRFEEKGLIDDFVEQGSLWRENLMAGRTAAVLASFFDFSSVVAGLALEEDRKDVAEVLSRPWPHRLLAGSDGRRLWQDWNQLIDLMQKKQAEGLREPADLIRWLEQSAENPDPEGRDDAVRLETEDPAVRVMTMHASKGLEFPYVFTIGGLSGRSTRGRDRDYRFDANGVLNVDLVRSDANWKAHLAYDWEETKRLWYVAFTRASRRLWVILPEEGMFSQVESLLAESIGLTPGDRLPPHEFLNKADSLPFRERLTGELEVLAGKEDSFLSIGKGEPAEDSADRFYIAGRVTGLETADLPRLPAAGRDPVTSSYTSLTRGSHRDSAGDERDVDRHTDGAAAGDLPEAAGMEPAGSIGAADGSSPLGVEPLPLLSDRGALFGTLVHSLFEESDFSKAAGTEADWFADGEIDQKFQSLAGRYYRPEWYPPRAEALKKLVRDTLRAPVPGLGMLCNLKTEQQRAEVEFLISLPKDSTLDGEGIRIPAGFLKGYIDLLVFSGDRWWVLDWKTNVPAGAVSMDAYDRETVNGMMDSHRYHLQYELYLLSLCRSLSAARGRAVDWEAEIGGAAYIFVRAARESDDRGIFFSRPDRDRMLSLAAAAGLEGVVK